MHASVTQSISVRESVRWQFSDIGEVWSLCAG